jgi:hypothetical protein
MRKLLSGFVALALIGLASCSGGGDGAPAETAEPAVPPAPSAVGDTAVPQLPPAEPPPQDLVPANE